MRTIGNNIPFTGTEYDNENDLAFYYEDGFLIATLEVSNDVLEFFDEMTEENKQLCYLEIIKKVNAWKYEYSTTQY
jgi:hypothetical protein